MIVGIEAVPLDQKNMRNSVLLRRLGMLGPNVSLYTASAGGLTVVFVSAAPCLSLREPLHGSVRNTTGAAKVGGYYVEDLIGSSTEFTDFGCFCTLEPIGLIVLKKAHSRNYISHSLGVIVDN